MDVQIKLQGFAELAAALKDLPDNIAKNALRAAVASGAKIVRDDAKSRIGSNPGNITGTLRRSLYMKQIRELSGLQRQTFFVGARQGKKYQSVGKRGRSQDAYYAKWVEFGHFSRPANGRLARGRGRTAALQADVAAGRVHWIAGRPFLRPAFDASKERAIGAMAAKLRERLERFRVKGR